VDSSLGKCGYEAYAKSTGGKTFDGRDMPMWEQLPENIKRAWADASKAIAEQIYKAVKDADAYDRAPETQPAPSGYPV